MYATTRQFLDDLGLDSLDRLPMLDGSPSPQALASLDLVQPELLADQSELALDEASVQAESLVAEATNDLATSSNPTETAGPRDPQPPTPADATLATGPATAGPVVQTDVTVEAAAAAAGDTPLPLDAGNAPPGAPLSTPHLPPTQP